MNPTSVCVSHVTQHARHFAHNSLSRPSPSEKNIGSPDCCGSVDWGLWCKPKGRWFNSLQGPSLGRGPGPQPRASKGQPIDVSLTQCCYFPCLSPCPSSLSKNQLIKSFFFKGKEYRQKGTTNVDSDWKILGRCHVCREC